MERRVAAARQIPGQPGHRCARPVDPIDRLAAEDPVDRRLDLEHAVVLHGQTDPWSLDYGGQGGSDRSERAKRRDAPEPQPLGPPLERDQRQHGEQARAADHRQCGSEVSAQHPQHRQLEAAEHREIDRRGGQPGGDPGQREPRFTGRRACASHDDGVTTSVRNPFSGAL